MGEPGDPRHVFDHFLGRVLPAQIGSYVLEQRISSGSSYADYAARHATIGHKVLFRHERWPSAGAADGSDPSSRGRSGLDALEGLKRSRRLQAELQHPKILPVIDFFADDGEWFSVFAQPVASCSLEDLIASITSGQRPPCTIAEFVTISAGVTEGVAAIHQAGFVHRTLGTHNILVDTYGYVRLADLGCATPIGADDTAAKAFRWFMRPISAAPEQLGVEGHFSTATDTWALGVALFELRYSRHPFCRERPAGLEVVRQSILENDLDFPAVAADGAEQLLQPWLRRLLEKTPENRYADALEAQRDLQAIAAEIEGRQPLARAFVAMPFANRFDSVWRAVRAACAACRVFPTRVDQTYARENIWDEICEAIRASDVMIAVATADTAGAHNPNVMLEIGYARALHKPVLLLTDAPERLPFDLRTQRALAYDPGLVGGGEFYRELVSYLAGVVARSGSNTVTDGG